MLGQQNLETYASNGVGQRILQDVAVKFEGLVAGRGLFGAANEVSQALVQEVRVATDQMQAATAVVGRAATNELNLVLSGMLRSLWPVIVVLGLVASLGVVILVQHASTGRPSSLVADIATPLLGLAGAVGLFTARRQAPVVDPTAAAGAAGAVTSTAASDLAPAAAGATPGTGLADRSVAFAQHLGTIAGEAGTAILADFTRGFDLAQADLGKLGYAVGLSYPLVEYFVLDSTWGNIRGDVEFMDQVIWNDTDRRDEIVRVVSAAFGSVGIFAMASAQDSP